MKATETPIVITRFMHDGDDYTEVQDFLSVEAGDGEVDVHLSPRTDDVVTFSLTPEQAWNFAREMMRSTTYVEAQED